MPVLQTDQVRKVQQDLARGATPELHATRATAPHGTTCRIGRQPDHQLPLRTALGFRPPDLFRFSLSDLHHARCCCALHYLPSLLRFPLPGATQVIEGSAVPELFNRYCGLARRRAPRRTVAYAHPRSLRSRCQPGEIPKPVTYRVRLFIALPNPVLRTATACKFSTQRPRGSP